MEYEVSDSSGTDDDLPPSNQNRYVRGGRAPGSGQSAVISATYSRMQADMEAQIHHLEQDSYRAVLRAFKAQSDQLSWDKEGLITELGKELRVSDDEHREILTLVNRDDIIQRISTPLVLPEINISITLVPPMMIRKLEKKCGQDGLRTTTSTRLS